jgi:tetratricopeptide (TPR) repeat protein
MINDQAVKAWEEEVIIPTYSTGNPGKNPMFFEKRIYQGSSGAVYPNPVIETIANDKADKTYHAVYLENKYLKIMILPELGGRVQMAYDKIKQRHFVYYNQVVKPALVGLTGPWISGGIEFNWPQHHRPSTFEPIDHTIEDHKDGSKTIWVSEIETMFHTKGMAGFTLHPDKAFLEIKAKLYNRSPLPQTFLWWANPAVKVNDHYQSVFPPDVNAVYDHGKRDVSTFPIATGTYYKVDYSPGTDISRYKNIPVPTSYMAINSRYDFVGGYEHDTQAGLLHVADHHVSPGKKQWTWGHGDFGQAWDRNLTDEDGPYIEMMTGVFTDNQPDFSWLMPYEEKTFTQYFLPYRELGLVKNATKDLLLALNKENRKLTIQVFATSRHANVKVIVKIKNEAISIVSVDLSPEEVYRNTFEIGEDIPENDISLTVTDTQGRELIMYKPAKNTYQQLPEPAKPAAEPKDIENNETLFLTGQHLEQYRHATYSPVPYYQEALTRDPNDIRSNNALGAWFLRRGQFAIAEPYFRKAIATSTSRNPNPYDTEPYYNLGLCLKLMGKTDDAYDAFYKATWSNAWQDSAYFSIAQIDINRKHYDRAFIHICSAIDKNARNNKAFVLKAVILRKQKRYDEAIGICSNALDMDCFNLGALFEKILVYQETARMMLAEQNLKILLKSSRKTAHNLLSYALDYAAAGLFQEAAGLLKLTGADNRSPLVYYHLAFFAHQQHEHKQVKKYLELAELADPYLCFPNRLEDIAVLQFAMAENPRDAKAPYYLGNLWYDKRQYDEAIQCWEISALNDDSFPTVNRNLGIAYFNKRNDPEKSLKFLEEALKLDMADARVMMELDQLYKRLNKDPHQRLKFLEAHLDNVNLRDDLYLEKITIYNFIGSYQEAYDLLMARKFHPWEGGEGKVSGQYVLSLIGLAKRHMEEGTFEAAISCLELAMIYPHNLGEGKLYGAQENELYYWLGCAHERLMRKDTAEFFFIEATRGESRPGAAIFYNDQQPDQIYYRGLAWQKLGVADKAQSIFTNLVDYAHEHMDDNVKIDYFAVSLPNMLVFDDDLNLRNKIHCLYILGLGLSGLGRRDEALAVLNEVSQYDAMHFGTAIHLQRLVS